MSGNDSRSVPPLSKCSETREAPREVPAFRVDFSRPRENRYAICVFVLNEGERIQGQLRAMKTYARQVDIIIADGGSTDGSLTPDTIAAADMTALLVKTGPGKLSAQMRMAFAFCLDAGYDGILTIDGNGKDGIEAIPNFIELLAAGYDHVQGSRYIQGGHHENTPFVRHWAVALVHAPLISLAARFRYTDTTNGFRAYSRKLLVDPRIQPFRNCFVGYELHYYLAIRAAQLGFRCIEAPVSRIYPNRGPVPTKISPVRGNLLVLKTLLKSVLHQYDP
jgi:dolichol-phosphate mannosyltransferase